MNWLYILKNISSYVYSEHVNPIQLLFYEGWFKFHRNYFLKDEVIFLGVNKKKIISFINRWQIVLLKTYLCTLLSHWFKSCKISQEKFPICMPHSFFRYFWQDIEHQTEEVDIIYWIISVITVANKLFLKNYKN